VTIPLIYVEPIYFAACLESSSHSKRVLDWGQAIDPAVKDQDPDRELVGPVHG
jgi:hypothetical protein